MSIGCRDNIMLLRVLYDQIIRKNSKCIVTYIDYTAASQGPQSIPSPTALLTPQERAERAGQYFELYTKQRQVWRVARAKGIDGKYTTFSGSFDINRGVIQEETISPVLFILALPGSTRADRGQSLYFVRSASIISLTFCSASSLGFCSRL